MSRHKYNRDTLWRLYDIGGADLALRYAHMAETRETKPEIVYLRFFEGGPQSPEVVQRQFASQFAKSSTRFVYSQIEVKNPWRSISVTWSVQAHYYGPDGSLLGAVDGQIVTRPEWTSILYWSAWGWEDAGNWFPGVYRVEVCVDSQHRVSGEFTIVDDRPVSPLKPGRGKQLAESPFRGIFSEFKLFPSKGGDAMPKQQPEKQPEGLGLEGWLNKLFPNKTPAEKFEVTQPLDDMAKMRRLLAIDGRYSPALMRARPGLVTEQIAEELKQIAADYEELLQAGPPKMSFYTEESLRTKIADALGSAGMAYEMLPNYPEAVRHFTAALEKYTALGKGEQAQRCQEKLDEIKYAEDGKSGKAIKRLRQQLLTLTTLPLIQAERMIELAGLCSGNGDDYEATELLVKAESLLDQLEKKAGGAARGKALGEALTESLLKIKQGKNEGGTTPIEQKMKVNGLYRLLYQALVRIYDSTDEHEKAQIYREKLGKMDSQETNKEFSEFMLRALKGHLGE